MTVGRDLHGIGYSHRGDFVVDTGKRSASEITEDLGAGVRDLDGVLDVHFLDRGIDIAKRRARIDHVAFRILYLVISKVFHHQRTFVGDFHRVRYFHVGYRAVEFADFKGIAALRARRQIFHDLGRIFVDVYDVDDISVVDNRIYFVRNLAEFGFTETLQKSAGRGFFGGRVLVVNNRYKRIESVIVQRSERFVHGTRKEIFVVEQRNVLGQSDFELIAHTVECQIVGKRGADIRKRAGFDDARRYAQRFAEVIAYEIGPDQALYFPHGFVGKIGERLGKFVDVTEHAEFALFFAEFDGIDSVVDLPHHAFAAEYDIPADAQCQHQQDYAQDYSYQNVSQSFHITSPSARCYFPKLLRSMYLLTKSYTKLLSIIIFVTVVF